MEKGINSYILGQFGVKRADVNTYSPLALAYIGDGIYDLVIRSIVVGQGNTRADRLHKRTSQLVKAHTQSQMIEVLLPHLSDEELSIYRRGRNAKSNTMAKNATGFEALMGYLYLKDEMARLIELVKMGLEQIEKE
jgi:ribonuclease-3 family protein